MTIFTDAQRFKCFGCGVAGDVIDLEEIAGSHLETWTAVVELSLRYGVDPPERPPKWRDWQNEKGGRRTAIRDNLADSYQRRYFNAFYREYLMEMEPEVRDVEADRLWDGLRPMSTGRLKGKPAAEGGLPPVNLRSVPATVASGK